MGGTDGELGKTGFDGVSMLGAGGPTGASALGLGGSGAVSVLGIGGVIEFRGGGRGTEILDVPAGGAEARGGRGLSGNGFPEVISGAAEPFLSGDEPVIFSTFGGAGGTIFSTFGGAGGTIEGGGGGRVDLRSVSCVEGACGGDGVDDSSDCASDVSGGGGCSDGPLNGGGCDAFTTGGGSFEVPLIEDEFDGRTGETLLALASLV